jgi:Histone chaperone domain CHZ
LGALDKQNIITTDRRTRGNRVDYTKALADDNGSKSGEEIPEEKKGAPAGPRSISPQRKPVNIDEEDEDEEEEYESDEDEADDYEEDEDE